MSKKQNATDFRYNTGATRIPWATVGESVHADDIVDILKFLVPAGDAKTKYRAQFSRLAAEVHKTCALGGYARKLTLGSKVKELEKKVSAFLGAKHAVFLTNATAGFEIAHGFAGVKAGDEVIVPAITFAATMLYPLSLGAKVVFADVDPITLNMDPADVERKITAKTKVIMPVHLGGYPVDMDPIMKIANARGITVLEDAAHGFGGMYKGKHLGTIGHFGAYSFHEVKNITSLGEGGILVTNEPCGEDFAKARFAGFDIAHPIDHWLYDIAALKWRGEHFVPGNHSATEIQAVALSGQLKRLNTIIAKRRKNAAYLNSRLSGIPGIEVPPLDSKDIKSTHHLYLLKIDPSALRGDIQDFKKNLSAHGVTQIAHFAPLYRFSMLRQLGYDTAAIARTCPRAEDAFLHRFTHLPLYDFAQKDIACMADAVIKSVTAMKR
ncbi:MAG: DegT/DnrJ/EryC1/StrS family aminotransferase [Spirochaetota bacterium]